MQITNYTVWKEKALAQQAQGIDLTPKRGEIFFQDKNGNLVPAAINNTKYNIAIDPSKVKEEEKEEIAIEEEKPKKRGRKPKKVEEFEGLKNIDETNI
mgnify:CR=1 FL=1